MKKTFFKYVMAVLMALLFSLNAYASDAEIGGIFYNLNTNNKVATVTYGYDKYIGDITIPSSVKYNGNTYTVTSIGDHAFYQCNGLTSITIPNSVTSIGMQAFAYCTGLTNITIPNSVTSIQYSAFLGCTGLTSITIPNSVTSIWASAFSGCSGLTSVTIPNSVTSIGMQAFANCSSLTNITIPNSVTSIGQEAFAGCSGLTSIHIPDGVTSIRYQTFYNCSSLTSITIPDGVTSIENSAFYGCSRLTSITIPDGLTSIGDQAFRDCSRLTSINIPDGVTSIGSGAFYGCSGLNSVIIGNNVTSIGDYAFQSCSGLTSVTIPQSVTSIGMQAFISCSGLTSVTIPNSVTSIGVRAFYNCSRLTSVVSEKEEPFTFGNNAFNGIANNCTLTVPYGKRDAYLAKGWTEEIFKGGVVETIAFADANVKTLCVANWDTNNDGELSEAEAAAVTALGQVFNGNTNITSFDELQYFIGLNSIGNLAFDGCNGLISVTIPNSVTSIGGGAFYGCSGLTSVTIPNSVTSILSQAFEGCSGLTSVTIPNTVTSIGYRTFKGCSGLTSVTIPNTVTSIGNYAFNGCSGLTSITIPNGVTSIGNYAFNSCSGLTSVTIPNSVTSIGDRAFAFCTGLTSVTIPNSVTSIGASAFYYCKGLTSIVVESGNTVYDSRNNCNALIETSTNTLIQGCKNTVIPNSVTSIGNLAFCYCSGLTSIEIPNSITSIGNGAFGGCGLTSITIPNSVTSIGQNAFALCSGLTSVVSEKEEPFTFGNNAFNGIANNCALTVPAGTRDAYIAAGWTESVFKGGVVETIAFADANVKALCVANWDTNNDGELSEAEAAAVTDLGQVFKGNTNITSFDELQYFIDLNSIGSSAFSGCNGLTSITIPNGVTSIGQSAFRGCSGLTSITIGNGVTSIGSSAFYNCSGLTSIEIPNSVTSIGSSAFYNCSGLTSIEIPNSVTSIGNNAFAFCTGLTSIVVESGNTVYDSRNNCNALIETSTNTLIQGCKNTVIPNSVTSIGNLAFCYCSGLTSIEIPNSITSIGNSAFFKCTGLTGGLIIPNSVTSIGQNAFCYCNGLTSITIPNGVTSIEYGTFCECSSLTSIEIPNSITSIGNSAFFNCTGLTGGLIIPNSVTSIGNAAFGECSNLTSITIPNGVTSIGNFAFQYCNALTSVVSEKEEPFTFGNNAFNGIANNCTLTVPYGTKSAYIAAGWTESVFKGGVIEAYLVPKASALDLTSSTPLYLYNVEAKGFLVGANEWDRRASIGPAAYLCRIEANGDTYKLRCKFSNEWEDRSGLDYDSEQSIWVDGEGRAGSGLWTFNINTDGSFTIGSTYTSGLLSIVPSKNDTRLYMSTDAEAQSTWIAVSEEDYLEYMETHYKDVFGDQHTGDNIVFADANVKALCVANWDTNGDGELSIAEAMAVRGLGEVFKGNTDITSFDELQYFLGLSRIGEGAFKGCENLASVILPRSLITIEREGFYDTSISSINFPDKMTFIGYDAFHGTAFETVTIPGTVKTVDWAAFAWCTSLKKIVLEEGVEMLGMLQFVGCTSLEEIILPSTLTGGMQCFFSYGGDEKLTNIVMPLERPLTKYAELFDSWNLNHSVLFTIPAGSAKNYLEKGYYNLSDNSALAWMREEFESEAASVEALKTAEGITADAEAKTALQNAVNSARTAVGSADSYLAIGTQIDAVKTAAKTFLAQATIAPETDVTAIVRNPQFDRMDLGWNVETGFTYQGVRLGYQNSNEYHELTNGEVRMFDYLETWWNNIALSDGRLAQTISNLPAGYYRLEADAIGTWQADESVVVTGVSLFMGDQTTAVATEDNKPEHYVVHFNNYSTQDVTIGVKWAETTANWVAFDNVRLIYEKSQDEYFDELAATASEENPVDMTFLIKNPSFDENNANGWEGNTPQFQSYNNAEFFQANFDFHQTISGLPDGNYLLKVKGFHRPGQNQDVFNDYMQGTDNASAVIYANAETKTMLNQASGALDANLFNYGLGVSYNEVTYYVPNTMHEASCWFAGGYYETELPVTVTDGTLTIGVRNTENMGNGHWVIFDDFRLYYKGNDKILYAEDATKNRGAEFVLPVHLDNGNMGITAFQFDLNLPDGVTLTDCALTDRKATDHSLSYSLQSDGSFRITALSLANNVFSGSEGVLVNLTIKINTSVAPGTYNLSLKNIEIDKPNEPVFLPNNTSSLNVLDVLLGDVNGDGNVTIFDAVQVVNYILGNNPSSFILTAADINGDGNITIFDAVSIVNIILNQQSGVKVRNDNPQWEMDPE